MLKSSPNPRSRGSSNDDILELQVAHVEPDEMDLTQRIVGCVAQLISGEIKAILAIH